MSTATKEPTNGTVTLPDAPATLQPLTVEQRLAAFQVEVAALKERYGIQLVPYIIKFNNGVQIAEAKYLPIE